MLSSGTAFAQPETPAPSETVAEVPPELVCPPQALPNETPDDAIVICVDATGPGIRYKMDPPGLRYLKPNRFFFVQVLHWSNHKATVDLGGQVGSYVPGARGKLGVGPGGDGFNLSGEDPVLVATTRTFAPRRPGATPLTVRLFDLAQQPVSDPLVVEYYVDETYSGAFRMGIAGVFFGGVDQTYQGVTRPDSRQQEIVATDDNFMDLDVVVGYSPYLDAGGRSSQGCDNAPFCFNPYFGIGLLSANGEGDIEFLKSVHLGVEWELTSAFAIGLTANLRRVDRLADGFKVGQPIDGKVPTEQRFELGMGIVINLSPSFFKIGAGGSDALLGRNR